MRLPSSLAWRVQRVAGDSMTPALAAGDYVVLRPYTGRRAPRAGDVVSFRTAHGRQMIKRLQAEVGDGRWSVAGDGVRSMPSIDLGAIPSSAFQGRVVWRIKAPSQRAARIPK
ncbi:MAG: S24/S26 family peptidase [Pseudomonadota bacterium]